MKKIFFLICFLLNYIIFVYPNHTAAIITENVNIRTDSTTLSPSLGFLNQGEKVEILEKRYSWYKIRLPEEFPCYVSSKYIQVIDKNKGKVTASSVNLRQQPSLESFVIGKIAKGTILEILQKEDDEWFKVIGYPNTSAWIHEQFVKLTGQIDDTDSLQEKIALSTQLIQQLSEPNMLNKKETHDKLLQMGEAIIPELETKLISADKYTTYSIIFILGELGKQNPKLTFCFLSKVNPVSTLLSSIYLDVVQNIVGPQRMIPYYYLQTQQKLTSGIIEKSRNYLYITYKKKIKRQLNADR